MANRQPRVSTSAPWHHGCGNENEMLVKSRGDFSYYPLIIRGSIFGAMTTQGHSTLTSLGVRIFLGFIHKGDTLEVPT